MEETYTIENQKTKLLSKNPISDLMNSISPEESGFCYVCTQDLFEGSSFEEHIEKNHQNLFSCMVCGKKHQTMKPFIEHISSHSLSCETCNLPHDSLKMLLLHLKFCHNSDVSETLWTHDHCYAISEPFKKEYTSKKGRKMIRKVIFEFPDSNYEPRFLPCPHCPKKFTHFRSYNSHLKHHSNASSQKEKQNFESCISSPYFMRDKDDGIFEEESTDRCNLLELNKKHFCDVCSKGFGTRQHLRRHEFTHRKKSEICKLCCLSFETLNELKEHRINNHTGHLPHICMDCGLGYQKVESYRDHIYKIHERRKKSYTCNICQKILATHFTYQIHLRSHSGTKPFDCTTCGKKFYDKHSMVKHEKLHTAESIYTCSLCDKSYVRGCLLTEHIKWSHATHAEIELSNFKCSVCNKLVDDIDCYIQHIYNHTIQKINELKQMHQI